ncbi:putative RNA recognition motif containing protein [Lyophyllum shimeji]|uniref:RNA recognition motif containing protein n=1 Tax=Lyophyllum shimeji TaxID=47721 RepID=A0A9P3PQ95_LYOSH|nr:putative RNA recognition motif containing protein [Lyophyllum shimeji]
MPPKKAKKISLNEFLGDNTLGSWADEMDSLPNAPATRTEDDLGRPGDRYGRRGDDFLSTRPDRAAIPRDDVPLPTQPPYTAFIGNLAFDLTESELEDFFSPAKAKSVKIIRDREDKPKGFGYIEFEELDGLKDALAKTGLNFSGRTIRVSVAEPPKERSGFGGGGAHAFEDDSKFDSPWRRDGPLPDIGHSRDSSRARRFEGPPAAERLPSVSEAVGDWRSSQRARTVVADEPPRRRSGFSTPEGTPSAADQAEVWTRGAKFTPTAPEEKERFGSLKGARGDMGPPKEALADESDWRSARPRSSISPSSSTPPTPQLSRRKLELLPRSGTPSAQQTPLSSPKMGPSPGAAPSSSRASPFGAAKPVDVTQKEKEVEERLDKEREVVKERLSMSRTSSRQASERPPLTGARTPPTAGSTGSHAPASPKSANASAQPKPGLGPSVRPTLSFASAAGAKRDTAAAAAAEKKDETTEQPNANEVEQIADKAAQMAV